MRRLPSPGIRELPLLDRTDGYICLRLVSSCTPWVPTASLHEVRVPSARNCGFFAGETMECFSFAVSRPAVLDDVRLFLRS